MTSIRNQIRALRRILQKSKNKITLLATKGLNKLGITFNSANIKLTFYQVGKQKRLKKIKVPFLKETRESIREQLQKAKITAKKLKKLSPLEIKVIREKTIKPKLARLAREQKQIRKIAWLSQPEKLTFNRALVKLNRDAKRLFKQRVVTASQKVRLDAKIAKEIERAKKLELKALRRANKGGFRGLEIERIVRKGEKARLKEINKILESKKFRDFSRITREFEVTKPNLSGFLTKYKRYDFILNPINKNKKILPMSRQIKNVANSRIRKIDTLLKKSKGKIC